MSGRLFEAFQRNDKRTFLRVLKKYQGNPPELSNDRQWADLYVTIVSNSQYKEYLELLLEYGGGRFFDKDDLIQDGKTALYFACENGCDENVLVLLQRGCDPDKTTKYRGTALHIASSKGYLKIVEYLLNYAANINAQGEMRRTPLHLAVMSGQIETSLFLLRRKADTKSQDWYGYVPSNFAYGYSESSTLARILFKHDLTNLNFKSDTNYTPLIHALTCYNSIELVHDLIESGTKIEFCDSAGMTPLHYAVRMKNKEILSLLLQSVDVKWMEERLANPLLNPFITLPIPMITSYFKSLSYLAIKSLDFEVLSILLNSKLPKSILQVPILIGRITGIAYTIYTPLTYLISCKKNLNTFLHLLLKHKITMLDEYNALTKMNWERFFKYFRTMAIRFYHPFLYLVNEPSSFSKQSYFFNLFAENDISSDYCLQCYHDNNMCFTSFDAYDIFYEPVIDAMNCSNLEALKLIMSNSAILEPDKLLVNYLLPGRLFVDSFYNVKGYMRNRPTANCKNLYQIYQYLISLKPLYYKQIWRPSSGHSSSFKYGFDNAEIWKDFLQEHPSSFSVNNEFANVTLQQLCRTTIRLQLREPTLNDNLCNFRTNILALPLPNLLKDYLLFKY